LTALGPERIARELYSSKDAYQAIPTPEEFSDDHVRHYLDNGFIAIDNVFTQAEVEAAKEALAHLITGGNPEFKSVWFEEAAKGKQLSAEELEGYVRKLMWFVDFDPRLKALSEHRKIKRIVNRLLGSDSRMIQDMALLKPAHVGREKPWHQDNAYFLYSPFELVMGTWVALDAATPENGCMHVIPGSHKFGPRPHYHDRDCQLPDELVDRTKDTVVPLKPGGVMFFSGMIHHGTPPNQSPARRRAVQFHYASVNCRKLSGDEHEQFFADKKGYAGCAGHEFKKPARPVHDADI
jgi:phytanoyl-CoA hydroxylase